MSQGFVSRDAELSRLTQSLQKALAGETQVCFITGEAGSGKTTLIEEFEQRSASLDPKLIFALGNCNAQTGISDPYLPFRSILSDMLTGDRVKTSTKDKSQRSDSILKIAGRALVEVAPELVGTLLPPAAIFVALARMAAKERGLFKGLEERAKASKQSQPDIEQSQIFLQYTALLRELSKECPLVIILDDLQWVDDASNALLFHLVRELKDCHIFFIGLYRPNDVAVGRNGDRHPLEQTLTETKRIYGDIWIDLDHSTQSDRRTFVDALIDSQPNTFSAAFREQLYQRTKGHALFTTELLRAMQDRGDLVQDDAGRWQESTQLDWDTLPARIEGIIEERIERLEDELRDILNVACVQGQDFIAEIIAEITSVKRRVLIKKLSELERCHRLVEDVDKICVGKNKLWNYTFSHALFQVYLYNKLELPERQMYHVEVAEALEAIYADHTETIAVQLAYHYTAAGEPDKASTYLQLAGEHAYKLSDFLVARNFFTQALSAIELDGSAPDSVNRAQLFWWLGQTYYHTGQYSDAENYYRQGLELPQQTGNPETIIQALIGLAQSLRRQHRNKESLTIAQKALALAQKSKNRTQECLALRVLGVINGQMDLNVNERLARYEESLNIATELRNTRLITACLNNIGNVYSLVFGDIPTAIGHHNQALKLAQQDKNLTGQVIYLDCLASNYMRLGHYQKSQEYALKHLDLSSKLGDIARTSESYYLLGKILACQDEVEAAIKHWVEAIEIADSYQRHQIQVGARNYLAVAYLSMEQNKMAWKIIEEIQPLTQKYTVKKQVHSELFLEGLTLLSLGDFQEARRIFESTRDQSTQLLHTGRWAYRYHRAFAQAGVTLLAPLNYHNDYLAQAMNFFHEAVEMCGWVGVLDEVIRVLREMQKADSEQLFQPIEKYLVEQREIAWNNQPSID